MEGVQIIVFVSRDFWDEFYITPYTFSSGVVNENSCCSSVQNFVGVHRNCGNEPCKGCNHHSYPCETRFEKSRIGNPHFSSEGGTRECKEERLNFKQCYKTQMNGYFLSVFVHALKSSEFYRSAVISHLLQCKNIEHNKFSSEYPLRLIIQLTSPGKDIIDYSWNERMLMMALERRELDHAMSWLSTLGGAFSALGDHFDHCAVVAGHISIKQMKLALRLGDPMTVARCKLYLALSLLQRGYLREAKHIIKEQYLLANKSPVLDTRLIRMCHGIWAKLKYAHYLKKQKQNAIS